jgi:hypothetical protein
MEVMTQVFMTIWPCSWAPTSQSSSERDIPEALEHFEIWKWRRAATPGPSITITTDSTVQNLYTFFVGMFGGLGIRIPITCYINLLYYVDVGRRWPKTTSHNSNHIM